MADTDGGLELHESPVDPSSSSKQPSKRKRPGNPSSRGVANLTPEQLARKRANDREAQRAIRERTKAQIDRLNQRIRELESAQPFHDLQVVLRQKEAVQAENEDIKRRLSTILSIIQPILGNQGLHELAAAAERSPHLQPPIASAPAASAPPQPSDEPYQTQESHPPSAETRSFQNPYPPIAPELQNLGNGQAESSASDSGPAARQWAVPGIAPTSNVRGWQSEGPPYDPQRLTQEIAFNQSDERLGVDFLLDGGQRRNGAIQQGASGSQGAPASLALDPRQTPPYAMLPRTIPATCLLDSVLLDFLAERHSQAAQGTPMRNVIGPTYPNFTCLVYPDRVVDSHPTSKIFTDILRTFPDISLLPEQVAVIFIMFLVMRWQIDPTQENYDRLPDWIQPRPSQLFVPHPCWVDYLPWPKLRDHMIYLQPFQALDTFFVPYTTTLSLNWPYEPRHCLLPASNKRRGSFSTSSNFSVTSPFSNAAQIGSPQTPGAAETPGNQSSTSAPADEHWLINPAFESHLRDLNNWSLGPAFRNTMPHLAEYVRIKEGK